MHGLNPKLLARVASFGTWSDLHALRAVHRDFTTFMQPVDDVVARGFELERDLAALKIGNERLLCPLRIAPACWTLLYVLVYWIVTALVTHDDFPFFASMAFYALYLPCGVGAVLLYLLGATWRFRVLERFERKLIRWTRSFDAWERTEEVRSRVAQAHGRVLIELYANTPGYDERGVRVAPLLRPSQGQNERARLLERKSIEV